MSDSAVSLHSHAPPRLEYRSDISGSLDDDVLAAITFGATGVSCADSRFVHVGLESLSGAGITELWRASGAVSTGTTGSIRHAADANFRFGVLEMDETAHGGIAAAAEAAYTAVRGFVRDSSHPHLLRVWNYFDAINRGAGDDERYKQFCVGRASGLGPWAEDGYPAATVIGRRDGDPTLQIYWLSSRVAGIPLENPRQTTPHRYPRQYGPRAPQFSRAMLIEYQLVAISGTASIVGHASHHPGNLDSQVEEVVENIGSVLRKAAAAAPSIPPRLGAHSHLKIYLRDAAAAPAVDKKLRELLPAATPRIILAGDICRTDLLVEADGAHAP